MNNRELKFRIWDKQDKSFLSEEYLKHFKVAIAWDGQNIYQNFICGDKKVDDEVIIQQYTGLKDKNGVLIFEGDIVKYARAKVERIESSKGCFSSKLIELGNEIGEILFIKPSFCLSFDHIRYDDINEMCVAEHRYEVIGNIFETPELLHIVNNDNNNQ